MKKFLLSLSAILVCAGMAGAESVTLSVKNAEAIEGTHYDKELNEDGSTKQNERWQPLESLTIGNYDFSFTSPDSGTQAAYYNAAQPTIRLYKGCTMTISSTADMAEIIMSGSVKTNPTATASAGTVIFESNKLIWRGTETVKTVTISVNGSVQFSSFDISDEVGGSTTQPGDPAETGTAQKPLSVEEFLALGLPTSAVANTYVKGYIVGYLPGQTLKDAVFGADGEPSKTNILIAATADCKDINLCIPVQIPAGSLRDVITLGGDPSILGKVITLLGSREKYFGVLGLKSVSAYAFGDDIISGGEPTGPSIYTGLVNDAANWEFVNVELPSELTYVWMWDTQYKNLKGNAFKDKGIAAKAWAYSPEIDLTGYKDVIFTFDHAAKYQTVLKDLCGAYIIADGAEPVKVDIKNWPVAGGWDFTNAGEFPISATGKVKIGFLYQSEDGKADTWEIKNFIVKGTNEGAVEVIFDSNAPVIYYDLNGRVVNADNLQKGIYIMRQGNKVTKVVR